MFKKFRNNQIFRIHFSDLPKAIFYLGPQIQHYWNYCFVHSIFHFWFLVTFGDEVTKLRKYHIIFVYILHGKMGKTEKNHATKVSEKPKDENMGWTRHMNPELYICYCYCFLWKIGIWFSNKNSFWGDQNKRQISQQKSGFIDSGLVIWCHELDNRTCKTISLKMWLFLSIRI